MLKRMIFPAGFRTNRPSGLIVHKTPQMPIMIDRAETEPETVREFTGQPLYTVLDRDAREGKMLQIFTQRRKAEEYIGYLVANPASSWSQKSELSDKPEEALYLSSRPFGYIELYEDTNLGGCVWHLPEYGTNYIGDFMKWWACGFLFWGWKNADKTISSVDSVFKADYVILCDQINLGGSWFSFPGRTRINDLVPFGWNDRASSMFWLYTSP